MTLQLYSIEKVDEIIAERDALLAALVDFVSMAESPQINISGNWDGSTEGQWKVTIREARAAIAKAEGGQS